MSCVICGGDASKKNAREIIPHGRMCGSCAYCFFCWKRSPRGTSKWLKRYTG